jgi:2-dehydro-3-deoxygluconokinase
MTDMNEIKLLCVGECMMELRNQDDNFVPGFAGDTTNFCIYLKRLSPVSTPHFFSSVGQDSVSQKMLTFLNLQGVNTDLVSTRPDKTIGLYMIQTDAEGERTFTYWRSESAARQMFLGLDEASLIQCAREQDYFYFSGISLAILDQADRDRLLTLAQTLRGEGKTIIFDPNLRPALWSSISEARTQITRAFEVCDILLSSYEDDHLLFGETNTDTIIERLMTFGIDEIILTNGEAEIKGAAHGKRFTVIPAKPEAIIDTTAAGDSFNAGYIVSRHKGCLAKESAEKASSLAALVISHAGAIIPQEATDDFCF